MSTPTPALPDLGELAAADAKIASFLSDLDSLASSVEHCLRGPLTDEESIEIIKEGREFPPTVKYDPDLLARIVLHATEWIGNSANVAREARRIQAAALALYWEGEGPGPVVSVTSEGEGDA